MAFVRRDQLFPPPHIGFQQRTPVVIPIPAIQFVQQPQSFPWAEILVGGLLAYGAYKVFIEPAPAVKRCSACGKTTHTISNCPKVGPRAHFRGDPLSAICECCGQYAAEQRHHPNGRADNSDRLDLCRDCHLHCGHKGDWMGFAVKPRICVFTGGVSAWRNFN